MQILQKATVLVDGPKRSKNVDAFDQTIWLQRAHRARRCYFKLLKPQEGIPVAPNDASACVDQPRTKDAWDNNQGPFGLRCRFVGPRDDERQENKSNNP